MERVRLHHDVGASYDAWVHDAASSGDRQDRAADHRYRHRELRHRDHRQGHPDGQQSHRLGHRDDRQSRHQDHRDDQHLRRGHRDDRQTRDEPRQGRMGAGYQAHDRDQRERDGPWACHHREAAEWGDPSETAECHHREAAGSGDLWAKWGGQAADPTDGPEPGHEAAGWHPRGPQAQRRAPEAYRRDAVAYRRDGPEQRFLRRVRWR